MDLLRKEFALFHPSLLKRRVYLFKLKQQPGERFSSLMRRFDDAWESAEMEDITREQLKVVMLVAGTRDQELVDLFLELEDPSCQDLLRIAYDYEARQRLVAQMEEMFPKRKSRRRRNNRQ